MLPFDIIRVRVRDASEPHDRAIGERRGFHLTVVTGKNDSVTRDRLVRNLERRATCADSKSAT